MPLPERGNPISTDDLLSDIGADAGSELDVDYVSRIYYDLRSPHEFDEFYDVTPLDLDGGSGTSSTTGDGTGGTDGGGSTPLGAATTITITSTNPLTVPGSGNDYTVTYESDGDFYVTSTRTWITPSVTEASGNGSFTITVDGQDLESLARDGRVFLESAGAEAILEIAQLGNDASISIVRQTGVLTFPYGGGENEVYKIETTPDSTITWTANIDDTTYFSHRFNNTGTYTTNDLSGTGDAFIEVKAEPNDTDTSKSATVTVTATNLTAGGNNGPVTETLTVLPSPSVSFDPPSYSFTSQQVGSTPNQLGGVPSGDYISVTITAGGGYSLGLVYLTGTNSSNFELTLYEVVNSSTNRYYLYPTSQNTSTTTDRVANISVTIPTSPTYTDDSFEVTQRALNVSPPTVTITPASITFDDEFYSTQGLTGTVTDNGNGTISSMVFELSDGPASDFKLVKRFEDNCTVETGEWRAIADSNTGTIKTIGVAPRAENNTGGELTDTVRFYASNQGGTGYSDNTDLTQEADTFIYSDAGVSGFSVDRNTGLVTAPTAKAGITISSITYRPAGDYDSNSNTFDLETSNTTRYADVVVDVPAGYTNSNGTVSDTESTTQLAATEFIVLDNYATYAADIPADGGQTEISINTLDVYSTSWTSEVNQYISGDNWITLITPTTGTGDGSIIVRAGANWPGVSGYANPREARIRVYKTLNASVSDTIFVRQPAGTPPEQTPIISSVTPTGDISFDYFQSGNNNAVTITYIRQASTATNDITPNSVSFYMVSSHFAFFQTDNNVSVQDMGGIWTTSVTNPAASSFSVGVYPTNPNPDASPITAEISFSMNNTGGTASDTKNITQLGNVVWSLGTLPTLTSLSYSKSELTTFDTNVPFSFDYASSNFDKTNFGFYVDNGAGLSSTSRRLSSATSFIVSKNSNLLSSSDTLQFSVGKKVSVQYNVGNATTYGIATITSWNGSTLGVSFITRYGNTTTYYNSWEINQINGDGSSTATVYTRKINSGDTRGTTIRLNDTNDAYGLPALSGNTFQQAGALTGDVWVNGTNEGSFNGSPAPQLNYTSVYGPGGYPSPTYYTVGLEANYGGNFTAEIIQGTSYAGLSTSFDSNGTGTGIDQFYGRTRTDNNTIFYINLKNNTTTSNQTIEVYITFPNQTGSVSITITNNADAGTGFEPGDGKTPIGDLQ